MFVHMKKIPAKTADALDLIIEFATLGEYGLEYPGGSHPNLTGACQQEGRQIMAGRKPSVALPRGIKVTCPRTQGPATTQSPVDASKGRPRQMRRGAHHEGNPAFAAALRPPRIKLSFTN